MEKEFQVGIFTATHGLRGEIKVYPTTSDISRFDYLKDVILKTKEGPKVLKIVGVRYQKGMVLVKFEGINDINDIERYKGSPLFVTRENAAHLKPGQFFIADLIGMPVVTDDGRALGTLTDVLQTGANDVFIVQGETKEYLLPKIPDCVKDISLEENRILVHMMDGLEDL